MRRKHIRCWDWSFSDVSPTFPPVSESIAYEMTDFTIKEMRQSDRNPMKYSCLEMKARVVSVPMSKYSEMHRRESAVLCWAHSLHTGTWPSCWSEWPPVTAPVLSAFLSPRHIPQQLLYSSWRPAWITEGKNLCEFIQAVGSLQNIPQIIKGLLAKYMNVTNHNCSNVCLYHS